MTKTESANHFLSQVLALPCGAVLKNRLVKSAMSDSMADGEGNPTPAQARLYERWTQGGVALSIIGEVQIDPRFPEKPGNLVLGEHSNLEDLRALTTRASVGNAHIWPQIGHAGALSYSPISNPKGPSAIEIEDFKCAGMSLQEVKQLPEAYAKAATIAKATGFTGVQIHAGHGFLLSQFLSPLFNHRDDQYGGSIEARCRIIVEVIDKVRSVVGPSFPIGIKINSSDQLEGGLTEAEALVAIQILDKTSIDLIELSGGTYFPGAKSSSDSTTNGAYFVEFSQRAKRITDLPIVVTGGFKTCSEAANSLASDSADMVGVARAMVLNPSLANDWLAETESDPAFPRFETTPPGGITAWYTMLLTALGHDKENDFSLSLPAAIDEYEARDQLRCVRWKKKFSL